MARIVEYNEEQFLQQSTALFLSKGFEATSMRDILSFTGMNRHSLYKNYGDKVGLYRKIVQFYQSHFFSEVYQILELEPKGLATVKRFFSFLLSSSDPIKCVMVKTMAEKEFMEKDIYEISKAHFDRIKKAILNNFSIAQKNNELPKEENVQLLTDLIVGTFQGLPVSTNMVGNKKMLEAITYLLERVKN